MFFQAYKPSLPLQPFVEKYWIAEDYVSPEKPVERPVLPITMHNLVFNYGDVYQFYTQKGALINFPRSSIIGQVTTTNTYRMFGNMAFLGVQFKPTGFYDLFQVPMPAFNDACIPFEEAISRETLDLPEQLASATSHPKRIQTVEQFLSKRLRKNPLRSTREAAAAHSIQVGRGNISIRDLADQLNSSERQFRRKFSDVMGISPKLYCQIVRFNYVLRSFKKNSPRDWQRIIEACGYYDQAHFIKEFHCFAGQSPSAYFSHFPDFDRFFRTDPQEPKPL